MKFKRKILLATAASLAIVASTVQAAEIQFDEARFGATWIDMPLPERQSYHEYDFFGLNAEVLFAPVDFEFGQNKSQGFIRGFFTPRPHVGTTVSFNRHTPTSVYTGLTWHHPIGDILFLESSFGAALHNGELENKDVSGGKTIRGLGSYLLFRESVSIGVNVTENTNVVLQLTHMSHAGLAGDDNSGQTDLALKVGRKF